MKNKKYVTHPGKLNIAPENGCGHVGVAQPQQKNRSHPGNFTWIPKSRSASAQGVILAAIVQQLEQAFSTKTFPIPKKIGIKTLSHLGHYDLQKRTGFVKPPQLLHQKMTVEVVDNYLSDCRNQNNLNLPLLMNKYVLEMPRSINCDMPSPIVDIQPGAVPYHRKRFEKIACQGSMMIFYPMFSSQCGFCVHPCIRSFLLTSLYRQFSLLSISSLWTCIDMSLPSGVPYPPKLLGRDALGLNPCSSVDVVENVSPSIPSMAVSDIYAKFRGVQVVIPLITRHSPPKNWMRCLLLRRNELFIFSCKCRLYKSVAHGCNCPSLQGTTYPN